MVIQKCCVVYLPCAKYLLWLSPTMVVLIKKFSCSWPMCSPCVVALTSFGPNFLFCPSESCSPSILLGEYFFLVTVHETLHQHLV